MAINERISKAEEGGNHFATIGDKILNGFVQIFNDVHETLLELGLDDTIADTVAHDFMENQMAAFCIYLGHQLRPKA